MLPIGIVANPLSGKDIRRLAGKASVFDNREKEAIVRRAVAGAVAAGAREFAYMQDSHGIAESGLYGLDDVRLIPVPCPRSASHFDTIEAAAGLAELGCAAVLVLGGDGTNRAFVKGWRDSVLLPLSTGTNNVFPVFSEATVAGAVLGLLGAGRLSADDVALPVKVIDIDVEGESPDIALIDAVITSDDFIGARALLDADSLVLALLTRAEPAAVGITSLGGLLQPVSGGDDFGLLLHLGPGGLEYAAPLAPGLYADISVQDVRQTGFDEAVTFTGPGVLALDGERERSIGPGQRVTMRLSRTGPRVVDIEKAMKLAACGGLFVREPRAGEGAGTGEST